MGCCCAKKKKVTEEEKSEEIILTEEELTKLRDLFDKACSTPDQCSIADLEALWGDVCDKRLLDKLIIYLYGDEQKELINFDEFSKLYQIMMKEDLSPLAQLILSVASGRQGAQLVPFDDINQFMRAVLSTCFKAQKDTPAYKSWEKITSPLTGVPGTMLEDYGNEQLASLMTQEITKKSENTRFASEKELVPWLDSGSGKLISIICEQLYPQGGRKVSMFPRCNASSKYGAPSILDYNTVLMINLALPKQYQHNWKALFSSRLDGFKFDKMLSCIINQGPTITVVADANGHVFGGFAPVSWKIEAVFNGNEESFLFGIIPEMAIHRATGKNKNYMYLNAKQQVLPNGLGMGGQMGCFGFFLDQNLARGHCAKFCKTFGNKYLSSEPEFQISHVEVWGLTS